MTPHSHSTNGMDIKASANAAIQTSCEETDPATVDACHAMRNSQASRRMRNSIIRIVSSLLNALTLGLWLGGVISNAAAILGMTVAASLLFCADASDSRLFFRQVE